MRILRLKEETENIHAGCHFMGGFLVYLLAWAIWDTAFVMRLWPVVILGIGWELIDMFFGSMFRWLDGRGFSIIDVIWTTLGGLFCITLLS